MQSSSPRITEEQIVLSKTTSAFRERTDYHRDTDGLWIAEYSGVVHVRVTDFSLEKCRSLALEALDERLAAVVASPTSKASGTDRAQKPRKRR
jgi:hypothetical protein